MLSVGDSEAGWIHSFEGGHATADMVATKISTDLRQYKNISNVKYEDMSITCGTGMSKFFYDWVWASFSQKYARQNGAVTNCDYDGNAVSEVSFYNALVTEFGLPALDAASKDAAKMTIKWAPEYTRQKQASGKLGGQFKKEVQMRWLPSNFRLKIDGLDTPCSRVNKIEALTLKQKVVENPVGELRDYEKEPATLDVPPLVLTLVESHAHDFYRWHEDFVIKGNCGQDKEKNGSLEYLTPDLNKTLFTLTFKGLGIYKCQAEKLEAGSENLRRVKVEMYCDLIEFKYDGIACM
jgi:hypothetical protein